MDAHTTKPFIPANLAYVSEYFSTFLCIDLSDNSKFEINYLNTVDGNFVNLPEENRRCPIDSCWQHGDSPDEVLIYKDFPLTWRDSLTEYKTMCGNDSHLIFHHKPDDEEDTKMTTNTVLKVCLEIESTFTLTNLTTNMGQPTKGLFYVPFVTEKKTNTCQTIKFALIGQKELRALKSEVEKLTPDYDGQHKELDQKAQEPDVPVVEGVPLFQLRLTEHV